METEKHIGYNAKGVSRLSKKSIENMTREELETRITKLELHNGQLKNLCLKNEYKSNTKKNTGRKEYTRSKFSERKFDFSKHKRRHIALKFAYMGWDYQGYVVQESTNNTVEAELFTALLRTKLIESRETSDYHRCGRTDKGVSAFSQVVSLTVRSRLKRGSGLLPPLSNAAKEDQDKQPCIKDDAMNHHEEKNYMEDTDINPRSPSLYNEIGENESIYKNTANEIDINSVNNDLTSEIGQNLQENERFCKNNSHEIDEMSNSDELMNEINYPDILNRVLPRNIRALAWAPVEPTFSSRFDCVQRVYKYYFPMADLDLDAMRTAGQFLLGPHDFRNLCKMDVGNGVVDFIRNIKSVKFYSLQNSQDVTREFSQMKRKEMADSTNFAQDANVDVDPEHSSSFERNKNELDTKIHSKGEVKNDKTHENDIVGTKTQRTIDIDDSITQKHAFQPSKNTVYDIAICEIRGKAFLWHQIRSIMTVLILVGQNKENPDIIKKLLDIESCPRKPQFGLADEVGLNLYDTKYDGLTWRSDDRNLKFVIKHFHQLWTQSAIKSAMIQSICRDISSMVTAEPIGGNNMGQNSCVPDSLNDGSTLASCLLNQEPKGKSYKRLLEREKCESLETRINHFVKRKRIDPALAVLTSKKPKEV